MQQKRLLIALLISTAILFLWTIIVPVKQPQPDKSQSSAAIPQSTSTPEQSSAKPVQPAHAPPATKPGQPHRTLIVNTPLYRATFDNRGAEVVSWVITRNKES